MKHLLAFFSWLAAVGLVLTATTHIAALLGGKGPLGDSAPRLFYGIFVVHPVAILASNRGLPLDHPIAPNRPLR